MASKDERPDDRPDTALVTRRDLFLELKSLKSDFRLLIFLSIAGNQALSHLSIPSSVPAAVALGLVVKVVLAR